LLVVAFSAAASRYVAGSGEVEGVVDDEARLDSFSTSSLQP
jgi:hypothetical protein